MLTWLSLLHRPASSGKSSTIQTLAAICGATLTVVPLSSGSDTSDLLGGYEQADASRRFRHLLYVAERLLKDTQHQLLLLQSHDKATVQLLLSQMSSLFGNLWSVRRQAITMGDVLVIPPEDSPTDVTHVPGGNELLHMLRNLATILSEHVPSDAAASLLSLVEVVVVSQDAF